MNISNRQGIKVQEYIGESYYNKKAVMEIQKPAMNYINIEPVVPTPYNYTPIIEYTLPEIKPGTFIMNPKTYHDLVQYTTNNSMDFIRYQYSHEKGWHIVDIDNGKINLYLNLAITIKLIIKNNRVLAFIKSKSNVKDLLWGNYD